MKELFRSLRSLLGLNMLPSLLTISELEAREEAVAKLVGIEPAKLTDKKTPLKTEDFLDQCRGRILGPEELSDEALALIKDQEGGGHCDDPAISSKAISVLAGSNYASEFLGFAERGIKIAFYPENEAWKGFLILYVFVEYPDSDVALYYRVKVNLGTSKVEGLYRHALSRLAEFTKEVPVSALNDGASSFGSLCAELIFRDWEARIGEFRSQLGVVENPEAQTRKFEMEAALLLAFAATISFLDNPRHDFDDNDIAKFREGLDTAIIRLFIENGWSRDEIRLWAGLQDERNREYRALVYSTESPSFTPIGKAFVSHALPALSMTPVDREHVEEAQPVIMATLMSSTFAASLAKAFGEMIDEQVKEGALRPNNSGGARLR